MMRKTIWDLGLVMVGSPSVCVEDVDGAQAVLQNRNFGTHEIIKIISIEEDGEAPILGIEPQHELPYTLTSNEYFTINIYAAAVLGKGYENTMVTVQSTDGELQFYVSVNDELLSVSEITDAPKVYPNPSNGQFAIEGKGLATIYNTLGQKVQEVEVNGKQPVNLEKGVYVVKMNDSVMKVVVK